MGVRLLSRVLCVLGLFSFAAVAAPLPPKSLSVTVIKVEIGEPEANDQEGAPIENVRVFAPSATVHFPVANEDLERLNLRIQPILDLGGDQKLELPWINASWLIDYLNRIPSREQVNVIRTENGSWAKAIPLGLYVDADTEKMTVAYQFLEWRLSQNHIGNPDAAVVQFSLDEIQDRVLTRAPKLQLPTKWQDQSFFVNHMGDKLIRVVVLGFEGAPNNGHKPGPLAPYIPSYQNKDHSAIVMVRSQLENMDKREVAIFRMPVGLLRTVSQVDLPSLSQNSPTIEQSLAWLSVAQIGNYRFDGMQDTPDERFQELKRDSDLHFAMSSQFDLTPDTCRDLIVREATKKSEPAE